MFFSMRFRFDISPRRVVASEVTPNHVRPASVALAVGVNWLFSFIISRITPNMLTTLGYGTFILFGCMCVVMAVWAFVALPETAGVALEDMHLLFDENVVIRSLQDAPGGRFFLSGKRVLSVEDLKIQQGPTMVSEVQEDDGIDKASSPTSNVRSNV
jgi:hypothetical protein